MAHSPCSFLPLLIPFLPPLSDPSLLTWNPPSCDRIHPPWSQVACKLTSHFSPLAHIPLIPKSRPPGVSQIQIYINKDDIANLAHKIEHTNCVEAVIQEKKKIGNLICLI
jgi:hypothetical protein